MPLGRTVKHLFLTAVLRINGKYMENAWFRFSPPSLSHGIYYFSTFYYSYSKLMQNFCRPFSGDCNKGLKDYQVILLYIGRAFSKILELERTLYIHSLTPYFIEEKHWAQKC